MTQRENYLKRTFVGIWSVVINVTIFAKLLFLHRILGIVEPVRINNLSFWKDVILLTVFSFLLDHGGCVNVVHRTPSPRVGRLPKVSDETHTHTHITPAPTLHSLLGITVNTITSYYEEVKGEKKTPTNLIFPQVLFEESDCRKNRSTEDETEGLVEIMG